MKQQSSIKGLSHRIGKQKRKLGEGVKIYIYLFISYMVKEGRGEGLRVLGKYELGRTLGQGNFGKVKYAKHVETGQAFAVKILDRSRVQSLNFSDQIKREIGTLKLLKHPSVIFRGDTKIPRWLSPDAQDLLRRMLNPNPITRIDVAGIKAHDWFKQDYTPVIPNDDDDDLVPYSEPSSSKESAVRFKSRDGRRTRERDSELELEIMAAATYPSSARLRPVNHLATRHLNSHPLVSKPKLLISVSRAAPLQTRFRGARLPSLLPVIRAQSSPGFAANGYSRSYSVRRSRFWGTRRLNREAWCSDMCKSCASIAHYI
ncbi:hypothetical protein BHE74_00044079 [Ensete ventricosum]|nr:hypothetical protein BHE74_00044079 [Ensete ventricosum]